jgi:hypothetical protein
MIFRRYYTIQSNKNLEDVKRIILGQHLKIHTLDFEISEKEGTLKVIPHAEFEEHIYTLPITRLKLSNDGKKTTIKMMSKPRRIDIGGPYLIMIFVTFTFIAGVLLYFFGEGKYNNTAYLLGGFSIAAFAFLWFRLEAGYFDYIRKIRDWVKSHV